MTFREKMKNKDLDAKLKWRKKKGGKLHKKGEKALKCIFFGYNLQ